MTYNEAEAYLYQRLPRFTHLGASAYQPGLERISWLCATLGQPHTTFKSIHIAGTNGKGSSSHYLASIFQEAGYKTGLYTSPHLKRFSERIKINGIEINEQFFTEFVAASRAWEKSITYSFFELTTAMAFAYFAAEQVDIAIIETGLGGRLDATNILLPECSLITNIGTDHKDILGNTVEQIAAEKAGIIKPNIPVVKSEKQADNVENIISTVARSNHTLLHYSEDVIIRKIENSLSKIQIHSPIFSGTVSNPLMGNYQIKNLKGVLKTCEIMQLRGWKLEADHIRAGIENTVKNTGLRGRWEVLQQTPYVVCDTAHNVEGMQQIAEMLHQFRPKKLYLLLGMADDKDAETIIRLLPADAEYIFTTFDSLRCRAPEALAEIAQKLERNYQIIPNVNNAIRQLFPTLQADDMLYIGGSNFVVAAIDESLFSVK